MINASIRALYVVSAIILLFTVSVPPVLSQGVQPLSPEDERRLYTPFYDTADVVESCQVGGGAGGLTGSDNAQKVYNFMVSKGLTPVQAAGVMGNLQAESGFIPDNQQNGSPWPSGGWGIAQWTNPGRRDSLSAAVLAAGLPYTNEQTPPDKMDALLAFELEYLYNESNARRSRDYPTLKEWEGLKLQTTVRDATFYWERNFERPLHAGQESRVKLAEALLARFGGTTTTGSTTVNTSCGSSSGSTSGASADQDTSHMQCPAGTKDAGIVQDYGPGRVPTVKIRICDLPTVTQVNASIAQAALNMVTALEAAGLRVAGDSWRSYDEQAALRRINGCPDVDISSSGTCDVPTAKAGSGTHEVALAIDFSNMCFPSATCPSSAAWRWLMEHAGDYGFKKNAKEAWHWSPNGN